MKTVAPRHQSALEIFKAMSFSDLVHDDNLLEVVRYLRGSTRLHIPAAWYAANRVVARKVMLALGSSLASKPWTPGWRDSLKLTKAVVSIAAVL